jgi:lipid A 3-O-deacylase
MIRKRFFYLFIKMKKLLKKYYTLSLLFLSLLSSAQKIDNTASFRDFKKSHYFRLNYDNDYFGGTDFYYTQGFNLELLSPKLVKNPANHLFGKLKNSEQKYGLSLELLAFTPSSIASDEILYGDRPFASMMMLKSFLVSTDTIHKNRLVSVLSIGLIGPSTFSKEVQTKIHEWIGDETPHGWQYQIRNEILLNYEIAHEKKLYQFHNLLALNSNLKLRLGTANTNITGGLSATFGKINSPFTSVKNKNNFQIYGYLQTLVTAVGFDASLQGGLFDRKSPYVIPNGDINRFTTQTNFGIIMQYKALYLEYSRSELSREFKTGHLHKWGGFRIGFKL